MTDREKLIALLMDIPQVNHAEAAVHGMEYVFQCAADYLIANGVIFAADNTAGGKCVLTNADRIRAMTDEELARFLHKHINCGVCRNFDTCTFNECEPGLLEWLGKPAEGNGAGG